MSSASKMKLRAEILSVLNKYNTNKDIKSEDIKKDIESLDSIEDKKFLAKILTDELISGKKKYAKFCSLFIIQILNKNDIEPYALKILNNKSISDNKKVFLLSTLKQKDIYFEPEDIESFMNDIDKAASDGVNDFLNSTLKNPEAQIDLLDFYLSITQEERISLLVSLSEKNLNNETINAFSLISNLELSNKETKILTDILLKTNSPYSIKGLKNLLNSEYIKDIELHRIKKKIKEIEFKNPSYKNLDFISDSRPYKSYISFVDGFGNFSLIFSRIDDEKLIDTFLTTVNIELGIISTIGFYKIPKKNFQSILIRLFADSPPIEINPSILGSILYFYSQKNTKTNTEIPYEYTIWVNLINDIKIYTENLSEYLNSKLNNIEIKESKLNALFNSKVTKSWFYTKNQNTKINEVFSLLNEKNIKSQTEFEKDILDFIDNKLLNNNEFLDVFKSKLLIQAYVSKLAKLDKISDSLYSICYNNDFIRLFLNFMMQKSVCYYLNEYISPNNKNNIFNKQKKLDFTEKEIKNFISTTEKRWQ